jgi:hypothetical protein
VPYHAAIPARSMGDFTIMVNSKQPDRKERHHSGQINFKDSGVSSILSEQDGYDTQRVLAGIAFELVSFHCKGTLNADKLMTIQRVKAVLATVGLDQVLTP